MSFCVLPFPTFYFENVKSTEKKKSSPRVTNFFKAILPHLSPPLAPLSPFFLFRFGENVDSWQIPRAHIPTRLMSILSDVDLPLHDHSTTSHQ